MRQLDRVSRELLARAWATGAGPGDEPFTIDLDSTICETYGLDKEGARRHNYTGQRGYHPLVAVAAGTGDVLMARLRQGRANTARGAAHFLRETVSRVMSDNHCCRPVASPQLPKFFQSRLCRHLRSPPKTARDILPTIVAKRDCLQLFGPFSHRHFYRLKSVLSSHLLR